LTCAYLVEKLDFAVDIAVDLFAQCRPPGIYKQDYLNELFRRYADSTDNQVPVAAPLPTWETNEETSEAGKCKYGFDEYSDRKIKPSITAAKKRKRKTKKKIKKRKP